MTILLLMSAAGTHLTGPLAAAPAAPSTDIAWDVALGVGSLVVLVGGITALVKRSIRPVQALGVLGVAVAVAVITALASQFSSFSRVLITLTVATAGAAMAVVVATRPQRRIR